LSKRTLAIHEIADLPRYRVVAFQNALLFLGQEYAWTSMHSPHYQEVSPQQDANRLLYRGRADVVISDANLFLFLNRQIAQEVDTSQPITLNRIFLPTLYRLAFHDRHLCEAFDRGLQHALRGDLYQRLARKYHTLTDRRGIPYFKPVAHS
jgi:polar amino acid transport system substrate-binding protein